MPTKNNDFSTAVDQASGSATAARQLVADRAGDAQQKLADTGRTAAAATAALTADAGAEAAAAKDKIVDTAVALKDRAAATARHLSEQLPQTPQQWQAARQQLTDRVRSNPRPWLIGTGAVVLAWMLGRRSARSS